MKKSNKFYIESNLKKNMRKTKRLLTFATGALITIVSGCTTTSIKDSTFYRDFAVQKNFGDSHKSHEPKNCKSPTPQQTPPYPEKNQCHPLTQRGLYTEPWTHKIPQSQGTTTLSCNEPRKVSERNIEYGLEKIVLHSNEFYVEPNTQRRKGELDFILKKEEAGTELRRSPYGQACGKIEIVSDKVYIPTLIKNKEGKILVSAALRTEGKFGVTAQTTRHNLDDVQVGVLYETNEDARFKLKTAFINGKEYFIPAAEDSFYIIPLNNTQIGTEKVSGRIRLTNKKDGFFRLEEIPAQDYNSRKAERQENDAGKIYLDTKPCASTQPVIEYTEVMPEPPATSTAP